MNPLNPLAGFDFGGDTEVIKGLNTIVKTLKAASKDDKIKGIYLDVNSFAVGGMATLESVRKALEDLKLVVNLFILILKLMVKVHTM